MGKWCLHASLFIFVRIIIKVAGNQDRHKSLVEFDFRPNQTTHFGVTCPWVTKISHIWTCISLKPVGQPWSNFMCSIIGVGGRLHKVLGLIHLGTLDSGERLLPFGLLVIHSNTLLFEGNASLKCVYSGLTPLSTVFQSYHDGVWLLQGAQCGLVVPIYIYIIQDFPVLLFAFLLC